MNNLDKWEAFRQWVINYKKENERKTSRCTDDAMSSILIASRYCIAISCEDILKKMDEFDEK
jgi:hypothetical protein